MSDPSGVLATPLLTLPRSGSIEALARLVEEHRAVAVVVGLPRSLSGRDGPAATSVRGYAEELATALAGGLRDVPVHLADERLTTVMAARTLSDRGVRARRQRPVVDQAAAVLILQSWLDREGGPHGG